MDPIPEINWVLRVDHIGFSDARTASDQAIAAAHDRPELPAQGNVRVKYTRSTEAVCMPSSMPKLARRPWTLAAVAWAFSAVLPVPLLRARALHRFAVVLGRSI